MGDHVEYKLRQIRNFEIMTCGTTEHLSTGWCTDWVDAPRPPHTPTTLTWTTKHSNLGLTLPSQPSIHAETKFRHCHLRMQLKKPPTARTSRCYNSGTIWTLHLAKVPKSIYASPDWFWGIRRVIRIAAAFKSASKVRKILLFRCLRKSSEWVCKLEIKSKSSPYSITGTPGRTLQQCRPWHLLP